MTLTFKDSDGVECTFLVAWRIHGNSPAWPANSREATLDDLTRAGFVRLATGSDGPTDAELWRIDEEAIVAAGEEASIRERNTAPLRALFTAGSASRQAEIDRLTTERDALQHTAREKELDALLFEERAQRKRVESELAATTTELLRQLCEASSLSGGWDWPGAIAETRGEFARLRSELAATKEKLAEVERERDGWKRAAESQEDSVPWEAVESPHGNCSEPPRAEAGESDECAACEHTRALHGSHGTCYCGRCSVFVEKPPAESKPEPQPSEYPLPWCVDSASRVWDAAGGFVAVGLGPKLAAFIVARCNAPEPSASVARSEVEALAKQWSERVESLEKEKLTAIANDCLTDAARYDWQWYELRERLEEFEALIAKGAP